MDSFEINKIIAAILLVVAIVVGLDKVSDSLFHVKKPENSGYKVEVTQSTTVSTSNELAEKIDITALMAKGDLDTWEKNF